MSKNNTKTLFIVLLIGSAIGVGVLLKNTLFSSKKTVKKMHSKKPPKATPPAATPTLHQTICKQLEKVYEGVSGFNIASEEKDHILSKGGAPTYGEIVYESMRAVITRLNLQPEDVFYDLGSGTGKFVAYMHMATKIKKSAGIELSKSRYQLSADALKQLQEQGLLDETRKIEFICGDMTEEDISDATAIFMCATCFSEELLQRLVHVFVKLKPGLRIVTLKQLPHHPQLKLIRKEHFPTTWSDGSPFHYYELTAAA